MSVLPSQILKLLGHFYSANCQQRCSWNRKDQAEVRMREVVLVSLVVGVQRSFCSPVLEDRVLETTITSNLLGFTPRGNNSDMLSLFSASVSHTYGFYGSPESLMPGRDLCHVCQLACGPCVLTSFLPTLFQGARPGFHFIQPYLWERFSEHSHPQNKKRNIIRIQVFQYSLDSLSGNLLY